METPTSIPELLTVALAERRVSQRAASLYMGLSTTAVNMWLTGTRVPDPDSCRAIAKWSGFPEEFVLKLAGHLSAAPPPEMDIIPELGVLIRRFTPEEQRIYAVRAMKFALELRDERARYDATPPEEA